jgi:proteic killer suppression protein
MIRSFADGKTEALFFSGRSKHFASIARLAGRRLQVLDNTRSRSDLRDPFGSHLESLKRNRKGQYSIRVNGQYRICFTWRDAEPHEVEIVCFD